MMDIDYRSQNEKAIDTFHLALKAKVKALVEEGFEEWEGEIESFGYTLKVFLEIKRADNYDS